MLIARRFDHGPTIVQPASASSIKVTTPAGTMLALSTIGVALPSRFVIPYIVLPQVLKDTLGMALEKPATRSLTGDVSVLSM